LASKQEKYFLNFLPKHVRGSYDLWYRLKNTWYTCCVCRIYTYHYYLVYIRDKKKLWKLVYSQHYNVVRWLSVRVSIILPLCIAVSRPSQWRERSYIQCMCARCIDFARFYDFNIEFWNCSDSLFLFQHVVYAKLEKIRTRTDPRGTLDSRWLYHLTPHTITDCFLVSERIFDPTPLSSMHVLHQINIKEKPL
jgi:hypothetical protein